jgi:hypothetical protein
MTTEREEPPEESPAATPVEPSGVPSGESSEAGSGESDDYGYDLAHEVKAALRIPVAHPHTSTSAQRGSGRPVDPDDGDLGYDDAHDV